MNRNIKVLLIIILATVAFSLWLAPHSNGKEIIPWRKDLAAAREEARTGHKLVFIDFTAGWCGYCQQMAGTTWADKQVAAEMTKMVPVQIDVDSQPDIAREYGVSPIPAFVIIDPAGNALKSDAGYKSPKDFLAWLNQGSTGP